MDWNREISAAATRIADHVRNTPVMTARGFGLNYPVELKFEHLQHTGSFKARGAFNSLLSTSTPKAGIAAASGGNHGAAVGYAASALGQRAAIYVPEIAGPAKIDLIRRTGADLHVVPGRYAEAFAAAQAYAAETGAGQIHAYDAPATVAGQGTCLAEWEDQGLQADTVLIAVGGGGLLAGSLAWLAGRRKVIAVEPENCPTLAHAKTQGKPVDVDVSGVAANALGARRIGGICFDLATQLDVPCLTVSDDDITAAQLKLWQELRQLVEPAGATALAALTSGAYRPEPEERVAVLICGGNIAPDPFANNG